MARLVNVWRDDDPVELASKQMPLIVDENLTVSARARVCVHVRARAYATPISLGRRPAWLLGHDGDVPLRNGASTLHAGCL